MQPHTSYIICATPRNGSTLLCEALKNTGLAGQPEEYFGMRDSPVWQARWGVSTHAEYIAETIKQGTTPNGVFGAKMMWGYFDTFVSRARQLPAYKEIQTVPDLIASIFPNPHYIWIRRRDTVRQAVSHAKARQTNIWAVSGDEIQLPTQKPLFSFEQIDFMVHEIEAHEAAWQRYFVDNGIKPFVVIYEDLITRYEETACEILAYLDIPITEPLTFAARCLRQQADEESEQWIQRYHQLKTQKKYYALLSAANGLLLTFWQSTKLRSFRTTFGYPWICRSIKASGVQTEGTTYHG